MPPLNLSLPSSALLAESGRVSYADGFYAVDAEKNESAIPEVMRSPWIWVGAGGALLWGMAAGIGRSDESGPVSQGTLKGAGAGSGGSGVLVGVVDTGADVSHPRIASNISGTYNAVTGTTDVSADPGHGTASASVITTMAPNSRIAFAKGLGGSAAQASKALNWAVGRGASVVSLSLGTHAGATMQSAVRGAVSRGVLVVAAAGNHSMPQAVWPAKFAGERWAQNRIIVVGALGPDDIRAEFSNWDPAAASHVVFAPGVGLSAARAGGGDAPYSGTSAATPVVAGQAAVIKGTWQFLAAEQIADIIFHTADRICSDGVKGSACAARGPDAVYGWGKANTEASLRPVGKLAVKAADGTTITQGASSMSTGAPSALAAMGTVTTVAVDDYNRGFDVSVAGKAAAARQALPASVPVVATYHGMKFSLNRGGSGAFAQKVGAAVEFSSVNQMVAFGAGTGGAQDSFFGLEGSGRAPLSLSGEPGKFNSAYFAMAENGTHTGVSIQLSPVTTVRLGAVGQGVLRAAESSLGGRSESQASRANRQVVAFELQQTSADSPLSRTTVLTAGRVLESQGFLGASGTGAMAMAGAADTSFVTAAMNQPLDAQTSFSVMASMGKTGAFVNQKASLLERASSATTLAWSVGMARKDTFVPGDKLGVTVAMPLRASSGSVTLNTAVSQNASDGSLNFERRTLSLAPVGKERQVEFAYSVALRDGGELALQASYRTQPGHDAQAPSEAMAGVRYSRAF